MCDIKYLKPGKTMPVLEFQHFSLYKLQQSHIFLICHFSVFHITEYDLKGT